MRLSKLLEALQDAELLFEKGDVEIDELFTDSRKQVKNGLFVCLVGGTTDSHEKVTEAIRNGAVALITERVLDCEALQILVKDSRDALGKIASAFYGEPSKSMQVIGVTGTNGKTTVTYMLSAILEAAEKKCGVIGTLGAKYAEKSVPLDLTTPDPIHLHALLADMRLKGVEYVVMEVSAHALFYKKTSGVKFAAGIFTNLTQDHLDFFENMQAYEDAKMRLFFSETCPLVIANADDEVGRKIGKMRENKEGRTIYYGLKSPSDCFAVITDERICGSECMLNINDRLCRVKLSMPGRHNVYNALAAAVCATEMGIGTDAVFQGLNGIQGVEGRLQRVATYDRADIFVDFAHTPDGLKKSIETLKKHCRGRLICLFGCGGNRDKSKRPIMGETVAKAADFAVITSDNPRFEDPLDIISDIEKGFRRFSARYVVVPDRKRALEYALDTLQRGDVLLVAGKGGERHQEIMGIKYPFNDQDIIEKLIEQKGKDPFA